MNGTKRLWVKNRQSETQTHYTHPFHIANQHLARSSSPIGMHTQPASLAIESKPHACFSSTLHIPIIHYPDPATTTYVRHSHPAPICVIGRTCTHLRAFRRAQRHANRETFFAALELWVARIEVEVLAVRRLVHLFERGERRQHVSGRQRWVNIATKNRM